MPLPELIELIPLPEPVHAEVTVPGSKSITNRALVLAALSGGTTTLRGALWSEDTEAMVDALRRLGFAVAVEPDPDESANRTLRVVGQGGRIPPGGSRGHPLELFVGNAGTAARFLSALVCLGSGAYRLSGVPRMHERPQAALFDALRRLGYVVDSPNNRLPAVIHGAGPRPGPVDVAVGESSQFASALLLSAEVGGWNVVVNGGDDEELPYVEMTRQLVAAFPREGGEFQIEPDASSGSYFWAAGGLNPDPRGILTVTVANWPTSGWQIDQQSEDIVWTLQRVLDNARGLPESERIFPLGCGFPLRISRQRDLGDSIMTAIVIAAAVAPEPIYFTDLGRLRLQECERVIALRTELTKCGARVVEQGDTLIITPGEPLHGARIETYNDHRMAMCFATLGLKVPGLKIHNPACVKKTFPNFFQKLHAAPPRGLGVEFWECDPFSGHRVRPLVNPDDLFAA